MTLQIEHDEFLTLMQNNKTIVDAFIPVATAAGTGDLVTTLDQSIRAMQLVHQAVKSSHSILVQVSERHELSTPPTHI